ANRVGKLFTTQKEKRSFWQYVIPNKKPSLSEKII
ncbi:amino acid ABC transporter permease, partial [Proteus mirabilis]